MSAMRLFQLTRHDPVPEYNRWTEISVLDRFENAASIKIGGDGGLGP